MIIYAIIYHIRNNKNFNIDMSIKYNTIISTVYQQYINSILTIISASCAVEKKKKNDIAIRVYI